MIAFVVVCFVGLLSELACEVMRPDGACVDGDCPIELVEAMPIASDLPVGVETGVVLNLPPELRTKNWGGGSCVHASNVNLLIHTDQAELAQWWRRNYSGGEYGTRLVSRLESAGLRYAYVNDRDGRDSDSDGVTDGEQFLNYCVRNRLGAGIFYKPAHSINLVGMEGDYVLLLDNNDVHHPERVGHYERVRRDEFFRRWRGYGGFAWTLIHQPVPTPPRG